jgi:excisionase family DNA binding protein
MNTTPTAPAPSPLQPLSTERLTYTTAETARMLGVSVRSVHAYVHQGVLDAVHLPGRFLVTRDSVARLMATATAKRAADAGVDADVEF